MKKIFQSKQWTDYEFLERSDAMPAEADFALTLTDDCMEPVFKNGETVYVQAKAKLFEFEAAVFFYEGRVLCRQWCEDYTGAVHLLCANPKREQGNIRVEKSRLSELVVLGRVINRKKLSRPFYI